MRAKLILLCASLLAGGPAAAHALFPARQTVHTLGVQAWATLKAINGRTDISKFVVEVFEGDSWTPSRSAVAIPDRITVPASRLGEAPITRNVRVLIRLGGSKERDVMVCTKSINETYVPSQMVVNTRVCSRIKVRAIA
jgi:hypothetical protein